MNKKILLVLSLAFCFSIFVFNAQIAYAGLLEDIWDYLFGSPPTGYVVAGESCSPAGSNTCGDDADTQYYCYTCTEADLTIHAYCKLNNHVAGDTLWQYSQKCSTTNRKCEQGTCKAICGDGICGTYETAANCPSHNDCVIEGSCDPDCHTTYGEAYECQNEQCVFNSALCQDGIDNDNDGYLDCNDHNDRYKTGSPIACLNWCSENIPCTDTDGGENIEVKGVCTSYRGSFEDKCWTNLGRLDELFCSNNDCSSRDYYYKNEGYDDCIDGAAVIIPDNPPSVTASISPSTQFAGNTMTISASITDDNGISSARWYGDWAFQSGVSISCSGTSCSYENPLSTSTKGTHKITVEATDTNNQVSTKDISFTINSCTSDEECGGEQFIGDRVCRANKVEQERKLSTCANGGCSHSSWGSWEIEDCSVSGKVCKSAVCVEEEQQPPEETNCTDSDEGKDYYIKGYVEGNWTGKLWDYCDDTNTLREYYCQNDHDIIEIFTCSNGCEDGVCKNITEAIPPAAPPSGSPGAPTPPSILPSTPPEGTPPETTLPVTVPPAAPPEPAPPGKLCKPNSKRCLGNELQICSVNGMGWNEFQFCEHGCNPVKTQCNPSAAEVCTDSDNGSNLEVRGTTYGPINGNYTTKKDFCMNETRLTEYICVGNKLESDDYNCENGCKDGGCIPAESVIVKLLQSILDFLKSLFRG